MLYVTTRNKNDAYTAFRALNENRGPDGGLYVPFRIPKLEPSQIEGLKDQTFGQCVAQILNLFFSARLEGWDVDFSIGRSPAKLTPMSHRIMVGELWHNLDSDFARMVRSLTDSISGPERRQGDPSNWAWLAIRLAALFGLFAGLERIGITGINNPMDVVVPVGDFSAPMAAWYGREMGLPVQNIICACNENGGAWDLLHHGEIHTDAAVKPTNTPDSDMAAPADLERLIFETLGLDEAVRYSEVCRCGGTYAPPAEQFERLRQGMYGAVISQKRVESIIHNVYRTHSYLLGPSAALAYGGLQDYRAVAGESRGALLLIERSPMCTPDIVAKALGISVSELKSQFGAN